MGPGKTPGFFTMEHPKVLTLMRLPIRAKPWNDVLKPSGEDRPLGYVASGSHGIWPGPGSWVYKDASSTYF